MGNCFALCKPIRKSWGRGALTGYEKVLRIVKSDGKILEYKASILVKVLLLNFAGYGVGISKEASQHLPPNYELKIGQIYYLLPSTGSVLPAISPNTSLLADSDRKGGLKRIKVILTKQQLQELLSKKVSVEEVLSGLQKKACDGVDSSRSWRPKLETILEGSE